MLVLTRKKNEAIQIGNDIEVKVLAIEGDQIKIGIDAPQAMDIHRKEVYMDIQHQNKEALGITSDLLAVLSEKDK